MENSIDCPHYNGVLFMLIKYSLFRWIKNWMLNRSPKHNSNATNEIDDSNIINEQIKLIFDTDYYLLNNLDVDESDEDPLINYLRVGWKESRNPNKLFNVDYYLNSVPGLRESGGEPLAHYLKQGSREGYNPSIHFNITFYLDRNHDVRNAGLEPLTHFIRYGASEGREPNEHFYYKSYAIKRFSCKQQYMLPVFPSTLITIIIYCNEKIENTFNCICSILTNSFESKYEILLIYNSEDHIEGLAAIFCNIKFIKNEQKFYSKYQQYVEQSKSKYIVFLNNDLQVQTNWLDELVFVFEHYNEVGAVSSKLVYSDNFQCNNSRNDLLNPNNPQANYIQETDSLLNASIIVRRDIFCEIIKVNNLIADKYIQDIELSIIIKQMGYKIFYQPFSEIISHTSSKLSNRKINSDIIFLNENLNKKHILVIDHDLPKIDKDAGSRCISNFIDCFLSLNYKVTFLGLSQKKPDNLYKTAFQRKGIEVLYGEEVEFENKNYFSFLKKYLHLFDFILLSRGCLCAEALTVLKANGFAGKILYFGHDLGYLRMFQHAKLFSDLNSELIGMKLKAYEDFMYKNADISLVCSTQELINLKNNFSGQIEYIQPYYFETVIQKSSYSDRSGILFVGGFDHFPNQDAIKWFLDFIYPRIQSYAIPINIIGSNIPDFLAEYQKLDANIKLINNASTEYLDQIYSEVRVVIAPLRIGAGVKGKVLEAFSKGLPVVGTDYAFEGIPKEKNFIHFGNNNINNFTAELIKTYFDENYWAKLAEFGPDYINKNFSKDGMLQIFRRVLS